MKKKILVIGWDACEWKVVNELIGKGLMPTLEKFLKEGSSGKIATLDPPISPMLWTSIATGVFPDVHGITNFIEPDPDPESKNGIRPVSGTSRKVKAIWNILNQEGYKSNVVGWWPTHPAEPINGCMVSNFYHLASATEHNKSEMISGTVHPKRLEQTLSDLRMHITEITGSVLRNFVPRLEKADKTNDKGLFHIANTLTQAISIHNAATYLLENEPWDFMAVYYDAIDHFSHLAMKFHPPKQEHIDQDKYELYKDVITSAYRFHDMMLDRILELVDEDTTVMIMSDHGFHSDNLRPKAIPNEPSGPTYEHSPYGFFAVKGPGISKNKKIFGGSVIDITPTILAISNLPIGSDMSGKALLDIFEEPRKISFIPSWENVEGDDGMHKEKTGDLFSDQEAINQLIDLGYIEKPSEDKALNIKRILDESKVNLARGFIFNFKYEKAIPLLKELCEQNNYELRFALRLQSAYLAKGKIKECEELNRKLREINKDKVIIGLDLNEGILEMTKNNLSRARQLFDKVLAVSPNSPMVLTYIGNSYLRRHLEGEAESYFRKSLNFDPHNVFALEGLAKVLMATGREEEAFDVLMILIEQTFFFPRAHEMIGEILIRGGYYEKAVESFELTRKMNSTDLRSLKRLVEIYSKYISNPIKLKVLEDELAKSVRGEILIVTGLPRSGTSMVMQILEKAGILICKDDMKKADDFNPNGYYGYSKTALLTFDTTWLTDAVGKAIKIPADLIEYLPEHYNYKIIYVQRDFNEILKSTLKTNTHLSDNFLNSFPTLLAESYSKYNDILMQTIENKPLCKALTVNFNEAFNDKESFISKILGFLNQKIEAGLVNVINEELYKTRSVYK